MSLLGRPKYKLSIQCEISDFRREVFEKRALLGCYAACSGVPLKELSGQPIGYYAACSGVPLKELSGQPIGYYAACSGDPLKELSGQPIGYYAACSGVPLKNFRDNLSVPSSKFKAHSS